LCDKIIVFVKELRVFIYLLTILRKVIKIILRVAVVLNERFVFTVVDFQHDFSFCEH